MWKNYDESNCIHIFLSTYKYSMLLGIKNWPRSEILAVGKRGEHQRLVRK